MALHGFDDFMFDEDNHRKLVDAFADCGMTKGDAEWLLEWYPEMLEGWFDQYDGDIDRVTDRIRAVGTYSYGHNGCDIIDPNEWEQVREDYPEDEYLIFQDAGLSGVLCWPSVR